VSGHDRFINNSRKDHKRTMKHQIPMVAVAAMMLAGFIAPLKAQEEPMKVSRAEAMSAATTKPTPSYPTIAKQLKVEGEVTVQVLIGEEGKVEVSTPVTGNPILTRAAVDTLKEWRFKPFQNGGKAVKAQTVLSFVFKM
jgi:TonB family protein